MPRYLVVANQTLGGAALEDVVRSRMQKERDALLGTDPEFHIVVPATAPADQAVPVKGDATSVARGRLDRALDRLSSAGAQVTGEIGAADPMQAISDALDDQSGYIEIFISTLPRGLSKWLRTDLSHRVERKFDLPVTTVESPADVVEQASAG